eukprot:8268580-Pyramimonas_sp.AAC.1
MAWVFDGFQNVVPAQWYGYYSDRAVVTPTNESADELNEVMQQQLDPATMITSRSVDSVATESVGGD